ncbi:hypothetical protein [Enterocloster bolteae]|uniref:hypothetical protein n=1 Tax=Enterocloster bolteae TaxID=208479 RepID=UPI0021094DED|nr:hypothetical protein [Enterocloster bolteae]MCQ5143375.1 hypothetical protein [Enterocloster bolteae]
MRILTIGGNEYKVEFSFEAAEYKACVDKVFKVVSGGYIMKRGITGTEGKAEMAEAMMDGTADMFSDMASLSITCFYAGLLENNPVEDEKAARQLFKQFVKENANDERATFPGMYEFLKECMEEDGFFKLTGLDKYLKEMSEAMERAIKEAEKETEQSTLPKVPTDRKRKSISTK